MGHVLMKSIITLARASMASLVAIVKQVEFLFIHFLNFVTCLSASMFQVRMELNLLSYAHSKVTEVMYYPHYLIVFNVYN